MMPKSYDFDLDRPKISIVYIVVVFACVWLNMTQKLNGTEN